MTLLLLLSLAWAGKDVQDMDMVRQPTPTGWRHGLVAGRSHCPGKPPSLAPAGDGRPCTYHDPSPLLTDGEWRQVVELAEGRDAAEWSRTVPGEMGAWLVRLTPAELGMAWGQVRMVAD